MTQKVFSAQVRVLTCIHMRNADVCVRMHDYMCKSTHICICELVFMCAHVRDKGLLQFDTSRSLVCMVMCGYVALSRFARPRFFSSFYGKQKQLHGKEQKRITLNRQQFVLL